MMSLITTEELIDRLRISESSLNNIRHDDLAFPKPKKIGKRRIVWSVPEVEAWVEGR